MILRLENQGAERLLGKGDTYVRWSDNPSLVRVQGVFLTDENINDIIDSTIKKYLMNVTTMSVFLWTLFEEGVYQT